MQSPRGGSIQEHQLSLSAPPASLAAPARILGHGHEIEPQTCIGIADPEMDPLASMPFYLYVAGCSLQAKQP